MGVAEFQHLLNILEIRDIYTWKSDHPSSYLQLKKIDASRPHYERIAPQLKIKSSKRSWINTMTQDEVVNYIATNFRKKSYAQILRIKPETARAIYYRNDIEKIAERLNWNIYVKKIGCTLRDARILAKQITSAYGPATGNPYYPRFRSRISRQLKIAERSGLKFEVLLLVPELNMDLELSRLFPAGVKELLAKHALKSFAQVQQQIPKLARYIEKRGWISDVFG